MAVYVYVRTYVARGEIATQEKEFPKIGQEEEERRTKKEERRKKRRMCMY